MMRTSTPDRDVARRRTEEDEEAFTGSFSKKTPPKKTAGSDRWNHYTFRSVLATGDVFRVIRRAGQSPHWIYRHLSRCSCAFCIFSSPEDLRRAAVLRPGLYRRYAEIERRTGHTLSPTRVPLPQLTGIPVESAPTSLPPCERLRLDPGATPSARP